MFFLVPVVRLHLHKVLAKCGSKEVACNVSFFIMQLQLQAVRSLHSFCFKGYAFNAHSFAVFEGALLAGAFWVGDYIIAHLHLYFKYFIFSVLLVQCQTFAMCNLCSILGFETIKVHIISVQLVTSCVLFYVLYSL